MSWHPDDEVLVRYAAGRLDETTAISLEAHLPACEACRRAVGASVDRRRLDRMWTEVVDVVDRPRPAPLERVLRRTGVPGAAARLVAVAPPHRLAGLATMATMVGLAAVAARLFGGGGPAFVALAPLVPVAGIAVMLRPGAGLADELGTASPIGGFRLVLVQCLAVLAVSAALAGAAVLVTPEPSAAWVVPAVALAAVTIAVSSVISTVAAGAIVGFLWLIGLALVPRFASDAAAEFGVRGQVVFGVIAAAAAITVMVRRGAFEMGVDG
jgi:hypothetical protein